MSLKPRDRGWGWWWWHIGFNLVACCFQLVSSTKIRIWLLLWEWINCRRLYKVVSITFLSNSVWLHVNWKLVVIFVSDITVIILQVMSAVVSDFCHGHEVETKGQREILQKSLGCLLQKHVQHASTSVWWQSQRPVMSVTSKNEVRIFLSAWELLEDNQ